MADKYNGWTNYQTWLINLWLTNERGSYEYYSQMARDCLGENSMKPIKGNPDGIIDEWTGELLQALRITSSMAKKATEEMAERLENEITESATEGLDGFRNDLMSWSLQDVNWKEIARHFIDGEME